MIRSVGQSVAAMSSRTSDMHASVSTTSFSHARSVRRSASSGLARTRRWIGSPELPSFGETFHWSIRSASCGVGASVPFVSTSMNASRQSAQQLEQRALLKQRLAASDNDAVGAWQPP